MVSQRVLFWVSWISPQKSLFEPLSPPYRCPGVHLSPYIYIYILPTAQFFLSLLYIDLSPLFGRTQPGPCINSGASLLYLNTFFSAVQGISKYLIRNILLSSVVLSCCGAPASHHIRSQLYEVGCRRTMFWFKCAPPFKRYTLIRNSY
jgi:hypothetical protein